MEITPVEWLFWETLLCGTGTERFLGKCSVPQNSFSGKSDSTVVVFFYIFMNIFKIVIFIMKRKYFVITFHTNAESSLLFVFLVMVDFVLLVYPWNNNTNYNYNKL